MGPIKGSQREVWQFESDPTMVNGSLTGITSQALLVVALTGSRELNSVTSTFRG